MAFVLKDRVRETTTTTGTGAVTLLGAVTGYQSFATAGLVTNDTCYYAIVNQTGTEWETGLGTYNSTGPTITRTTVYESSAAGAAVNFSAGTKDVFICGPSSRSIVKDNTGLVTLTGGLTMSASQILAAAGTTSIAPVKLQSGTNLTSAAAGSIEYNGTAIMGTPIGTQRGLMKSSQIFVLNADLAGANATGAQNIFGKSCTVSSSTIYLIEMDFALAKTAGTTSHTISYGFGGTATVAWTRQHAIFNSTIPGTSANGTPVNFASAAWTSAVYTAATTTASVQPRFKFRTLVSISAGGTIIPQYSLSAAPGGAYSTVQGSYIIVTPLAANGANVSIGTWA